MGAGSTAGDELGEAIQSFPITLQPLMHRQGHHHGLLIQCLAELHPDRQHDRQGFPPPGSLVNDHRLSARQSQGEELVGGGWSTAGPSRHRQGNGLSATGWIGHSQRMDFSVIGGPLHHVTRLESLTGQWRTSVRLDRTTADRLAIPSALDSRGLQAWKGFAVSPF
ncbi:MAG: hypothetical protein RLZZ117_2053 [Cyanobacteriota bacterium]